MRHSVFADFVFEVGQPSVEFSGAMEDDHIRYGIHLDTECQASLRLLGGWGNSAVDADAILTLAKACGRKKLGMLLGGREFGMRAAAVARLFGITQSAVTQWAGRGEAIANGQR